MRWSCPTSGAALLLTLVAAGCGRPAGATDDGAVAGAMAADRPASTVQSVRDGDLAASAALSATAIEVGAPVGIVLLGEAPPEYEIELPDLAALAPFQPSGPGAESRRIDPATGALKVQRRLVATLWESGESSLPALTFTFRKAGAEPRTIELPATPVSVASLVEEPFDPASFADIRPLPAAATARPWWPWLAGIVAAALLGALVVFLRSRRTAPAAPPTPEEWALAQLEALRAEHLPARGAVEPYFTRLVDVLRGYVERRLGLAAAGRSSEEFLRAVATDARFRALTGATSGRALEGLLRFADLVKFARGAATPAECDAALESVRGVVGALRPEPAALAPNAASRPEAAPA